MAAVPIILNGVMMPKGKAAGDKPVPAVFIGWASIAGLEVGGGPIIPAPQPPGEPTHPIVLPPETPIDPPVVDPPPTDPGPSVAVVLKPAPVTGGWGLAAQDQTIKWFYMPSESGAGPKK